MPRYGLLVAAVAILVYVFWMNGDGEVPTDPIVDGAGRTVANDFIGSRACAECHPKIARQYADHPMAGTLVRLSDAEKIADDEEVGDGTFEAGRREYRVEQVDGEWVHHEVMRDDAGQVIYDQAETVQFAIGAGRKGRSYLLHRGSLLFESPITWYSQSRRWELSPGYPEDLHYRFGRRVGEDCLACHSGRPALHPAGTEGKSGRADHLVAEAPFHETSIGCERCHGPGGRHAALYAGDDRGPHADSLIVNPSGLAAGLQEDICNQCHLEGKIRVLRRGRRFADFRPGERLGTTWTVYVGDSPFDDDGRPLFTSHVEQMHASRCFQASEGSMRCTSCHDPHRVPSEAEKVAFYKERCNRCHQDRGCGLPVESQQAAPARGSCIACHMPSLHSRDVAHTTQADHRVVRHREVTEAARGLEREVVGAPWRPFGDMGRLLDENARRRADALAWFRQAADTRDVSLLVRARDQFEQILREDPDDTEIRGRLGFALFRAGDLQAARRELERALQVRPDSEPYRTYLGLIAYSTGDETGIRHFERLIELNPQDGEAYGPYADMLETAGRLNEAIRMAERGLKKDPTVIDMRRSLARFLRKAGRETEARRQERWIEQIEKRLR